MTTSRRGFLLGAGALLVAAPAIVRLSSIMPVKNRLLVPVTVSPLSEAVKDFPDLVDAINYDPFSEELRRDFMELIRPALRFKQLRERDSRLIASDITPTSH